MVSHNPTLMEIQHQIVDLIEKLRDMQPMWPSRPHIWCTNFHVKGHHAMEFPQMRGSRTPSIPTIPSTSLPTTGVAQVCTQGLYVGHMQFHTFPNQQSVAPTKYCEICKTYGYLSHLYPFLQKYSSVPNNFFWEFCRSPTRHTDQCRELDALVDC